MTAIAPPVTPYTTTKVEKEFILQIPPKLSQLLDQAIESQDTSALIELLNRYPTQLGALTDKKLDVAHRTNNTALVFFLTDCSINADYAR